MKWQYFFDNIDNWDDREQLAGIAQIEDIERASGSEIIECIDNLWEDKCRSALLHKAIQHGVIFTPADAIELYELLGDQNAFLQVLPNVRGLFTQDQIEDLMYALDDRIVSDLAVKSNLPDPFADEYEEPVVDQKRSRRRSGGSAGLGILAALFGIAEGVSQSGSGVNGAFRVGDHVRVRWSGLEGTVIDASGGRYMVSMRDGRKVESYSAGELVRVW